MPGSRSRHHRCLRIERSRVCREAFRAARADSFRIDVVAEKDDSDTGILPDRCRPFLDVARQLRQQRTVPVGSKTGITEQKKYTFDGIGMRLGNGLPRREFSWSAGATRRDNYRGSRRRYEY